MSINLLLNQRRKESHTLAVDDAGILSIPDEARDPSTSPSFSTSWTGS
jgi:hypothetical protein